MTLQPKITYNKTVSLNRAMFQRLTIWQAVAPKRRSFSGLVNAMLDRELPRLEANEAPSEAIPEQEGQP